jgi:hypothetical protein
MQATASPECGWTSKVSSGAGPCSRPPGQRAVGGAPLADGHCAFHSGDPDKDPSEVESALSEMQQSEIFECTGWVFPFWLDLQNVTFRNARFSECHFRFGADFSNSTFTGVADFTLITSVRSIRKPR